MPFADPTPDDGWNNSFDDIKCYDSLHVQAVINQIDGYTHDRAHKVGVPALFGTNFQSVSVGEKLAADPLFESTLIIIGAKHGQSAIDVGKRHGMGGGQPAAAIGPADAFDISDDGSLIWLTDTALTPAVVANLSTPANSRSLHTRW